MLLPCRGERRPFDIHTNGRALWQALAMPPIPQTQLSKAVAHLQRACNRCLDKDKTAGRPVKSHGIQTNTSMPHRAHRHACNQ